MSTIHAINSAYDACAILEDFEDFDPTEHETLEAWAYLIRTGQCWSLQGWYGRNAHALIEQGVISRDGTILREIETRG